MSVVESRQVEKGSYASCYQHQEYCRDQEKIGPEGPLFLRGSRWLHWYHWWSSRCGMQYNRCKTLLAGRRQTGLTDRAGETRLTDRTGEARLADWSGYTRLTNWTGEARLTRRARETRLTDRTGEARLARRTRTRRYIPSGGACTAGRKRLKQSGCLT